MDMNVNTKLSNAIYSRNWIKPSEKVPLLSKASGINMRLSALIETVSSEIHWIRIALHLFDYWFFLEQCEISKIPCDEDASFCRAKKFVCVRGPSDLVFYLFLEIFKSGII